MRLGTCLLYESHTLQGAHPEPADFCSALVADFYAAVDTIIRGSQIGGRGMVSYYSINAGRVIWESPDLVGI